jgi:hypothetical protein
MPSLYQDLRKTIKGFTEQIDVQYGKKNRGCHVQWKII